MPKQPMVPLNIAEFLRVTLAIAKQSDTLTTDQKRHIGMVVAMYETGRDEALLNQGFRPKQIEGFAKSAALALAQWFEDKALEADADALIEAMADSPPDFIDMSDFEEAFINDNPEDTDED